MSSANLGVCDPVNGGVHAMLRFPIVGAVMLTAVAGGVAYKCFPSDCDPERVRIVQNTYGQDIAICESDVALNVPTE